MTGRGGVEEPTYVSAKMIPERPPEGLTYPAKESDRREHRGSRESVHSPAVPAALLDGAIVRLGFRISERRSGARGERDPQWQSSIWFPFCV